MKPRSINEITKDMMALGSSPETLERDIEKLSESIVEGIGLIGWTEVIKSQDRLNNTLAGR
ncbi:hypothetical protein ACP8HI_04350 [Paenibacillus sp. FA6]|uniref:hypothetical protein n=1 Tax=Paenibacillus sp. FA6 TaxID=3413029 RepID=UPI003F6596D6